MKKALLTSVALLSMSAAAFAADLPARTMAPAPVEYTPMASAFTWTGFYVGVHAGANWQDQRAHRGAFSGLSDIDDDFDFDDFDDFDDDDFDDFDNGNALGAIFPRQFGSKNRAGFMGGAQAGYNQQFGMFVVGVEADLSYLANKRSDYRSVQSYNGTSVANGDATLATDLRVGHRMNWLGTARLRAGVALDRFLVYGTGGLAFGNPDHRVDFTGRLTTTGGTDAAIDQSVRFSGRNDDWKAGWTAGAGVEYAFTNNMTLKAEYLYYDLGRTTVTATSSDAPGFSGAYRFENKGQIGRVGLNWKF